MNTKKTLLSIALFIGAVLFSFAQKSVDESIQDWERAKNYTKEYLDAMPESGYSLKPTPEIRSFAEVMLHLTDANYGFTAGALSIESPVAFGKSDKTEDISKENVTKLVLAGYDFVIANLKKVTVDQLNEKTTLFGSFEMPKRTAFDKLFEHQTHHRGQTTLYLRLAGVVPPNEKLF